MMEKWFMPLTADSIVVALDCPDSVSAQNVVERLDPSLCALKVGKELFISAGPRWLEESLIQKGYQVFLDLKLHDIPNTVAMGCLSAARLGVWMLTLHASGGRTMMETAREALDRSGIKSPILVAVTVLTSLSERDFAEIGWVGSSQTQVQRLAQLAHLSGMDGVVCSAHEIQSVKQEMGAGFLCVTPGIRPKGCEAFDQQRVMTPGEAIRAGGDHLVIGRPITLAPDPLAALVSIREEMEKVQREASEGIPPLVQSGQGF
jgi:orotidine-5'-phosphate decarboxylase